MQKSEHVGREAGGWRFVVKPTHINAVNESLSAIALEIATAPVSPISFPSRSRRVNEALTAIAFAIAAAPASPILLLPNL